MKLCSYIPCSYRHTSAKYCLIILKYDKVMHASPPGEIDMNLNLTGAQCQVSHSSLSDCKTMVLDISHDTTLPTQSSKIFEDLNFRGQGQGLVVRGQGQGLENWSSRTRTFLEDNNTAIFRLTRQLCCLIANISGKEQSCQQLHPKIDPLGLPIFGGISSPGWRCIIIIVSGRHSLAVVNLTGNSASQTLNTGDIIIATIIDRGLDGLEPRSYFFPVCGPKFSKFGRRVWSQFATPFFGRRYLVPVRRHSRSSREVVRNRAEILMFLGRQIFRGGTPTIFPNFINCESHHRTCGKVPAAPDVVVSSLLSHSQYCDYSSVIQMLVTSTLRRCSAIYFAARLSEGSVHGTPQPVSWAVRGFYSASA